MRLSACAGLLSALVLATSQSVYSAPDSRPYTGPIIDMHLHAFPANGNGPAPNAICVGVAAELRYDPRTPWPQFFGELATRPTCESPIWGPATDEEVRDQTIAAMRSLNVTGVLSGTPARVRAWQGAAPGLFIAGYGLNIERDGAASEDVEHSGISAAKIGRDFEAGKFEVLAEVTNQYSGILADDPAFEAYWQVAAEHDIPVGIHVGVGPPGSPMLYPKFKLQSPRRLEDVLRKHPTLRVYLMHAGYPFVEDTKAMLYLYPQLYVEVGVLQAALPRQEYYAMLQSLVRAGFSDRILFGSDQMNWPGLIEEGIRAINEAPFLDHPQKRAILHDNAVRFLRLTTDDEV